MAKTASAGWKLTGVKIADIVCEFFSNAVVRLTHKHSPTMKSRQRKIKEKLEKITLMNSEIWRF